MLWTLPCGIPVPGNQINPSTLRITVRPFGVCRGSVQMEKKDEYLRQALEARKWADQSKSDRAKAGWLRVADQWLALLRGLSVDREAFDSPQKPGPAHQHPGGTLPDQG